MKHTRVAKRYALALFKSAKNSNSLDAVRHDAEVILQTIEAAKDFKAVLRSPVIQSWKKKTVIFDVFEGKISELSKAFLGILCHKSRENITEEIFEQFYELYNEQNGMISIVVTSAVELDAAAKASIEGGVQQRSGRKAIASYKVDPSLKGGLMIQIGDELLDSSLRTQLERMHQSLLSDPNAIRLN